MGDRRRGDLGTPRRLLRSLARMGRDPREWRSDKRFRRYLDGAAALAAIELTTISWQQLMALPERAARLMDLITGLRVGYLPAAAGAMVRLRLLLAMLGRTESFADLLLELPTETARANAELAAIADGLRAVPGLAERVADADAAEAAELLRTTPEAAAVQRRLRDFLSRYGHRETGSILLLRDPCWADAPDTVLALVQVLLTDGADAGRSPFPDALRRLENHPIVRALRAEGRVRRLVAKASAGIQVREDTHFELTRTMPSVRHAVLEAGRRLVAAGAIDAADDIWYLTWSELETLADPSDHPRRGRGRRPRRPGLARRDRGPRVRHPRRDGDRGRQQRAGDRRPGHRGRRPRPGAAGVRRLESIHPSQDPDPHRGGPIGVRDRHRTKGT